MHYRDTKSGSLYLLTSQQGKLWGRRPGATTKGRWRRMAKAAGTDERFSQKPARSSTERHSCQHLTPVYRDIQYRY